MKITNLQFRTPKRSKGNFKAYVDITFDDCFVVHNAKLIEGKNGLMICFPSVKIKKSFKDITHPITTEFRKYITDEVVAKYKEVNK